MAEGNLQIKPIPLKRYLALMVTAWTVCVIVSLAWNVHVEKRQVLQVAKSEARAHFNKDQAFRLWAASRDGVYVITDDRTPPNPYLSHLPERDISTPTGRELTLVNPAYMVRLVREEFARQYGVESRITSLKPLRPGNVPDAWERSALEAFEDGAREVSELTDIDGEPHLRLMRPVSVKRGCLRCHGLQGYEEGDIRGGIGVTVPLAPAMAIHLDHLRTLYVSHGLIWAFGLMAMAYGGGSLGRSIRERQRAEEKIIRAKQEWERTFDSIHDPIMILDGEHNIVRANKAQAGKLGMSVSEAEGRKCYDLMHGQETPIPECPHARLMADGEGHSSEIYEERLNGHYIVSVSPILDDNGNVSGSVHLAKDISVLKQKEEQIRTSLKEKEVLLKEIHHRVKNNMQIISSLNNIQSRYIKNKDALRALDENRNRIRSMALIHEKLYSSGNLSEVDVPSYLSELAREIFISCGTCRGRIESVIDADELQLNIDTLMPCGLIITELVSNALKYAFPGSRSGEVRITLKRHESNSILLEVSDNGVGMPEGLDYENSGTLGLRLVNILARQMEGTVEVLDEKGGGTTFRLMLHEEGV